MRNKILLISLMVLPFIASCNNGGGGGGGDEPDYREPLKFTCLTDTGVIHPFILLSEDTNDSLPFNLESSTDAKNWDEVAFDNVTDIAYLATFNLTKGQSIYFRGDNPNGIAIFKDESNEDSISRLGFFGKLPELGKNDDPKDSTRLSVSGNVMSILYKEGFDKKIEIPTENALASLFAENTSLFDASNFLLPATNLKPNCYDGMFNGCINLISTPKLIAPTLVTSCYSNMFAWCENLKIVTEAAGNCEIFKCTDVTACEGMFEYTKDWPFEQPVEEGITYYYVPQE